MPQSKTEEQPADLTKAVKGVFADAGSTLKTDLWKPEDKAFLEARARDLVGLGAKAAASTDPARRAAYLAASRDVVNHVKLLALIRMEAAQSHVQDALGKFFWQTAVPRLVALLPKLSGL